MKSWHLTLKEAPADPLDASALDPLEFADLSRMEIESTVLGDQPRRVGDLFTVHPLESDTPTLRLSGDLERFQCVGGRMRSGSIDVEGNVGVHAGSGMSGGRLRIRGNAGDHLGSPIGADRLGMNGGQIVVHGNVGSRCGHRMRRGNIWVAGSAGNGAGSFMIAGTILLAGQTDSVEHLGYGMQRGTIAVPKMPKTTSSRFSPPQRLASVAIDLMAASMEKLDESFPSLVRLAKEMRRGVWSSRGDAAVFGQGEILAPISDSDSLNPSSTRSRPTP